jgi:hypothetical protein
MIVRPWAEFTTSLPDDGIENETGFIQWPGKNVAEALAEILAGLGCTDVEIFDLEHAGYDVGFRLGKLVLAARVTVIDNPLIAFGRKRQPEYLDFLKRVSDALAKDGRFQNLRWFTDDEVLTGVKGAKSPLEKEPRTKRPAEPFESQYRTPNQGLAKVRRWAKFTSNVRGRATERLGYSVTQVISKMLARRGCTAIKTSYRNGLGWIIDFRAGKRRMTACMNWVDLHSGNYILGVRQQSWMANVLFLERPEYVEALRRLSVELAKDRRFNNVRWFFEREIHSGAEGAASPFG